MATKLNGWKRSLWVTAFAAGLVFSWTSGPVETITGTDLSGRLGFAVAEARPGARTVRRVDRRTTRRTVAATTAYLSTLPGNCPQRGRYWYCDGTYYEQVNHEGQDVYVVVTP
ncbi:hypothetical protein CLV78_10789 [Aliiruegeria haliotis]|uniref:Uncharacterized protein n=1 Tax=Aliiruegeria haliotis TaxID=1280846 RepID=A0A2T0RLU7_9RHOB|nr:hypothetical protein [Aliiruegeria haliotis]PRY22165.1 hypothetical protein CLV78_10789 [Aliiruegeria haliotis]